jgi:hypothetical protein
MVDSFHGTVIAVGAFRSPLLAQLIESHSGLEDSTCFGKITTV